MNNNANPAALAAPLCMLLVIGLILVLVIVVWWKIWEKTGYGGAMSLLMLLPIVNLIMFLVLAFSDWPIQQEVRRLRRELADRDEFGGGRFNSPPLGGPSAGLPRRGREGEGETGYRQ